MKPPPVSVDEEIRAVASMASLALALLGFFTNMRREALKEYRAKVKSIRPETFAKAAPDIALFLLTAGVVVVMAPLCFASFDLAAIGRRSGAVSSMFALIWLGFVVLLLFQLSIVVIRFVKAWQAGREKAKPTVAATVGKSR